MKQYFALCLFLFSGFLLHAQNWENFKLSNLFEVNVPGPVDSIEVKGQTVYTVIAPEGNITMLESSESAGQIAIPDYEHFQKAYGDLIQGTIVLGNGKLIDSTKIKLGKLEGKYLRFEITKEGQKMMIDCQAFIIHGRVYAFQFIQPKVIYDENAPSRDRFFKSIKADPSLTSSDQYGDPREKSLKNAFNMGQAAGYVSMILGVIALIVVLIVRSTRR